MWKICQFIFTHLKNQLPIYLVFLNCSLWGGTLLPKYPVFCDSLSLVSASDKKAYINDLKQELEALPFSELLQQDTLIQSFYCLSEELSDDTIRIAALSLLGVQYFEKSEFTKAKLIFEEILLKEKAHGFSEPMGSAHNYLSLIAEFEGELMKVYEHNKVLLEEGEKGNHKWTAIVCLNLGILYLNLGEYDEAENLFKRGLTIYEEIPKNVEYGWLLHRLGELKMLKKEPLKAIKYLSQATDYWKLTNNTRANCYNALSFGQAFHDLEEIEQSRFYYQKALSESEKNGFWLCQINALQELGKLAYDLADYQQTIELIEASINVSLSKNIPYHFKDGYEILAKAYDKNGLIQEANKYYQKHSAEVQESLAKNRLVTKHWVINMDRFTEQKKALQQLQKIEALNQEKLFLQNGLLFLALFSLLVISWVARKYFSANKKNKTHKTELLMLNKVLENQSKQLTIANQHIYQKQKNLEFELTKKLLEVSKQVETINQLKSYLRKLPSNNTTEAMDKLILEAKNDAVWEELNLQISQANNDFFERLSRKFSLTQGELRLCALLKMNLRTKEIANLTFKNPDSVKVARSRLRKKLGLTHSNIDISAFLNQI